MLLVRAVKQPSNLPWVNMAANVIAPVPAPADTTDYTAYIQKAMDSGADCLFLTWSGIGYVTLFQQLTDLGTLDQDDRLHRLW